MSHVITLSDGTKILITDLLAPGDFALESYHLASLLGYTQKSSTRKQILTDWKHLFEAGVDYELTHDKRQLEVYDMAWRTHMRGVDLPEQTPERGRLFLRPSGLRKLFERTTKDTEELERKLETFFKPKVKAPAAVPAPAPDVPDARTEHQARFDRKRNYQILETLLDHLKNLTDPGLKKLALMSAELGLGRELHDIRALLELETPVARAPASTLAAALALGNTGSSDIILSAPNEEGSSTTAAPGPGCAVLDEEDEKELEKAETQKEELARAYLAKRPVTQGPLFDNIPGVHYGLKQVGEKAGGYSAVQAGKAADLVAARMGHSHDDIRRKKLPFNDLPELPDNTSGKLRKMYRFSAQFANHVIVELRSSTAFVPMTHPVDLTAFGHGGDKLPNLSQGPFDDA